MRLVLWPSSGLGTAPKRRPCVASCWLAATASECTPTKATCTTTVPPTSANTRLRSWPKSARRYTFPAAPDQMADVAAAGLAPLPDTFVGLGPLGGLLSAFQANPNAAWLVAACDLPFLSAATLRFLVGNRQPARLATALQLPGSEFPEPLVTIWEPAAYAHLLRFLSLGYACPRKALINSDAAVLPAPFPNDLRNVNTPEEREAAEAELREIER